MIRNINYTIDFESDLDQYYEIFKELEITTQIEASSQEEAADKFLEMFKEAVEERLEDNGESVERIMISEEYPNSEGFGAMDIIATIGDIRVGVAYVYGEKYTKDRYDLYIVEKSYGKYPILEASDGYPSRCVKFYKNVKLFGEIPDVIKKFKGGELTDDDVDEIKYYDFREYSNVVNWEKIEV